MIVKCKYCRTEWDYKGASPAGMECPRCQQPFDHKTFEVLRDIAEIVGTLDIETLHFLLLNLENQWLGEQGHSAMIKAAIFLTDDSVPCGACGQPSGPGGTEVGVISYWHKTANAIRICQKCVEKNICWVTDINLNKDNDCPPLRIG